MTLGALGLILIAAVLHAGWNLLAKRAAGGALFVWLFGVASVVLYAPVVFGFVWVIGWPQFGWVGWTCVAGTAVLHLAYFLSLQRGYRSGDLSLVYPLARGTGPLLAAVVAILCFGERPSALALAGIALILGGVFVIAGGLRGLTRTRPPAAAVGYGLLTGTLIAGYTLLDKYAVHTLALAPLVYDWLGNAGRALLITPHALTRRRDAVREWQANRGAIIGVAVMSPLAYILVLTAMTFTPVSYVAPAREISILVGVVFGARLLSEGHVKTRLGAGAAIVCGVAALVIG